MKILIADDEKLIRYSLKSMLREIKVPAEDIHVACDGKEMVELAQKDHPDIAFVDIKMPKLDGLEAIDQARELSPNTKWIILTSYPSFNYAKEAIGLGATGYLLKPVSPQELAQTIDKIMREKKRDYFQANEEFESRMNALFHNTLSLNQDQLDFIPKANFLAVMIIFDSYLDERRQLEHQLSFCSALREKVALVINEEARIALCTLPNGHLVVLGAWLQEKAAARESIIDYFRNLLAMPRQIKREGVCVTYLNTEECTSYQELEEQLMGLGELAGLRTVIGVEGKIKLEDLYCWHKQEHVLRLSQSLIGLAETYREKNYLGFLAVIESLQSVLPITGLSFESTSLQNIRHFLKCAINFQPSSDPGTHQWFQKLKEWSDQLLIAKQSDGLGDIADQVTIYIEKNYMRNIGIAQIAYSLGITPNYLSALFHKSTGTTFVKYITRIRMSKAKELLMDSNDEVQQVARQVGYFSSRHFSKLFKQQFNCYPSEFQRQQSRD